MTKGLIAGITDYFHQSFNDILEDLDKGEKLVIEIITAIETNIKKLEMPGYWKKQPCDFKSIISYSLTHYKTI